ncbi:PepSY-associated TM helix domain-containing protein [Zobellia galactanivorans]|uniref:Conserved hypothetical membrane protein n=1 Tax=Zobellia galactanivorans (strain DSM 12802 / CCUG 47099 / CIP 106680 / NCIMB 13871 / Dsij) TaxID=63186 RepID=G0LCE2_ZOBGA|nr:PepSY-associated TM helix domain-containing protein [Zobellia galactanivorans]CAZ96868.1 Conserved hypothetical membrane protein [Zobellia galactanivorans]
MGQRTYNILLHTHTVSGIVISVALYVIFFAGSFSFFRDEIANWQRGHKVSIKDKISVPISPVLDSLASEKPLQGRDIEFRHYYNERKISVNLGASKDTLLSETERARAFFYLDTHDLGTTDYIGNYSLGEFLYRLHFFAQIPYPFGYYLSGFVAFFFLFAIVTGIIVHWKKIIPNFYLFRPWAKMKTLWTDAHTALGVIGLPFQLVYAVTGAFFMLKLIVVAPSVLTLYKGDQTKMYEELEYGHPVFEADHKPLRHIPNIDGLIAETQEKWKDFMVTEVHIFNYGDTNMQVSVNGQMDYKSKLNGVGHIIYKALDGSSTVVKDPTGTSSYLDGVKNMLFRLHFGDYAGYGLRVISFILGLVSCFVIISGVLIWLTARDKKNLPEKKRHFNEGVVRYYLAICLSMYPITAFTFIMVKAFDAEGKTMIYYCYFLGWLLLSVYFILRKNNGLTHRYCLLWGSILGFFVPITNGMVSGNWPWVAMAEGKHDILLVDLLWIFLSTAGLWVYMKSRQKPKKAHLKKAKTKTISVG